MTAIVDEAQARRLARAVLSDVALYNGDALRAGRNLGEPIEEGRQLYRSRVTAALHDVFEAELAASPLGRPAGPPEPGTFTPFSEPEPYREPPRPLPRARSAERMSLVTLVLALLVAILVAALFWRH